MPPLKSRYGLPTYPDDIEDARLRLARRLEILGVPLRGFGDEVQTREFYGSMAEEVGNRGKTIDSYTRKKVGEKIPKEAPSPLRHGKKLAPRYPSGSSEVSWLDRQYESASSWAEESVHDPYLKGLRKDKAQESDFSSPTTSAWLKMIGATGARETSPGKWEAMIGGKWRRVDDPKTYFQKEDRKFLDWYRGLNSKYNLGLSDDPDDPQHYYNYRQAYKNPKEVEKSLRESGHWPSQYKDDAHPNRFIRKGKGWLDTKYGMTLTDREKSLLRPPSNSELRYFNENPKVSGMATEDGRIILNPSSRLKPEERYGVLKNEEVRLHLREYPPPAFPLTRQQLSSFAGTPYEGNSQAMRETILARIISGDPSAKDVTQEQRRIAKSIQEAMMPKDKSVPGMNPTSRPLSIPEENNPEGVSEENYGGGQSSADIYYPGKTSTEASPPQSGTPGAAGEDAMSGAKWAEDILKWIPKHRHDLMNKALKLVGQLGEILAEAGYTEGGSGGATPGPLPIEKGSAPAEPPMGIGG